MTDPWRAWMPMEVAAYLADTPRLTTEQHGAYHLLIYDYWRNGPLPDDDIALANIVRLRLGRWREHKPVLRGYFQVEDGRWHHKRIDRELEVAEKRYRRRSSAGQRGGRQSSSNGQAMQEQSLSKAQAKTTTTTTTELQGPPIPPLPGGVSVGEGPGGSKGKRRRKRAAEAPLELPAWMSEAVWASWIEHRVQLNKPLSAYAARLQLKRLGTYRAQGHDPETVIAIAISRGWQGADLHPGMYGDGPVRPPRQAAPRPPEGEPEPLTRRAAAALVGTEIAPTARARPSCRHCGTESYAMGLCARCIDWGTMHGTDVPPPWAKPQQEPAAGGCHVP